MVTLSGETYELDKLIKRKWVQINWRTGNQKSYLDRGIKNLFPSFEDFRQHAISQNIKEGFHSHRPDRNKSYMAENLIFIPADEHRKITNRERRKLSDNDVRCIRSMSISKQSQRKLAKQFNVSQSTIWKIVNYKSYRDVF